MILVTFVFACIIVNVASESCYYQRCLGCRSEAATLTGTSVECRPENWVSPEWVHNLGHNPPTTSSKLPIEYRCLKMVATPDNKSGSKTLDVLKGCVPKLQVDSVCLALESIERARGHSDARCYVCWGNNCNDASIAHAHNLLLVLCILLIHNVYR